ncbi:hypothetical protein [Pseudaminobacter soli (ex Li et al. 2025)]|uniref:Uncharacterized protein n=1 Tax=Pseudaminobacter soli (ex Li et al. 2025) TaxID=1295366 RepID=A0A2P7S2G4_9HYPH|nr:hypothetical protein [Mesorhizobium soli]PSJ56616.1 hypothetical protein C7I85_23935 [Mesorhizobium soli]
MDSISRYHITVTEDGLWNVLDSSTGGPVELNLDGNFVLLYRLPEGDAKALSKWLNGLDRTYNPR